MPDIKTMDKLQWFKFSIIDWNMGKIKKVPEITQIRFINLCCLYWNKECTLSYDDAEIEIDKEHLDILISKKIVKILDNFIYIDFLNEQMSGVSEKREERKKNAILGNLKRWHPSIYDKVLSKEITIEEAVKIIENGGVVNDSSTIAPQSPPDSNTIVTQSQNIADKSREEKSIYNINNNLSVNWDALVEQFNSITGKKTKLVNEKTKRQIKARLKEGYTKDDFATAIHNCSKDKYHLENGLKYLTLEFISRADKLEKYATMKITT